MVHRSLQKVDVALDPRKLVLGEDSLEIVHLRLRQLVRGTFINKIVDNLIRVLTVTSVLAELKFMRTLSCQ